MEISPAKHVQFTPLVLYMPEVGEQQPSTSKPSDPVEEEEARKEILEHDAEMRKIFKRLSNTPKLEALLERNKEPRLYVMPKVTFPAKEGLKCMCYDKLMQTIRHRAFEEKDHYAAIKHAADRIKPSWLERAMRGFHDNEYLQFPLTTVCVRWRLLRRGPKYDLGIIKAMLNFYGNVVELKITTLNSCIAIFKDVTGACSAVQSRHIGFPGNKLHLTWWHKTMYNKNVMALANDDGTSAGIEIDINPYILNKAGIRL